ncbi:MAG: hypothetical protein DRQ60_06420 [Gammaproteobacteria bacterium]|nr:MAG: hypothetical protein DRQ54_02610 [Gammaproteobacteria bacterium]RLA14682.1 MAG: hypothetical protein DRQ60_06420 [Gammaproteobacteria bacterium]RLA15278.1 MAG: hypothetical protein DRQ52_02180 [Gammaproteobacteria bacterium]
MKFTQENGGGRYRVRGYDATQVTVEWGVVDEQGAPQLMSEALGRSFILTPDALLTADLPESVGKLSNEHLQPLVDAKTEVLLLGAGLASVFPAPELVSWLSRQGIGLESMNTAAACRTYNLLMLEDRRVAMMVLFD